jgi:type 1 fimbria pilin
MTLPKINIVIIDKPNITLKIGLHMIHLVLQRFAHICLGMFIFLLSHAAHAGCNNYGWTASSIQITTIPSTITLSAAQSSAPSNTPISDWYSISSQNIIYCPGGGNFLAVDTTLQQVQASSSKSGTYTESGLSYTIYNTSVTGIGYIIKTSGNAAGATINPTALNDIQVLASGLVTSNVTINLTVSVKFIKTTNLTASSYTLPNSNLVYFRIDTSYASAAGVVTMAGSSISVPITTCSVSTQSIQVALPSINTSTLPTLNATAGSTPFNVILNCPTSKNLYMTLTDNTNPGRTSSIIGLAPNGSTASGVGIQVVRNNSPVLLGPDSSATGNTNQFAIGQNQLGLITIPLSAQYIRTGTVQGGQAKAAATFTMSYQ